MTFTIVVPSFNQASYLEECLDSLVTQRGVDTEIILMDGGSTDGSIDIIKRYAPHLTYWQSQPDGGQAAALNAGFERATGEVFGWLCSDDVLLPGALVAARDVLESSRADVAWGGCLFFTDDGKSCHLRLPSLVGRRDLRFLNHLPQPSCFFHRRVWEACGGLDASMRYLFDWDLWLTSREKGMVESTTDRVLSGFRFHDGHKTSVLNSQVLEEREVIYRRHLTPELQALRARVACDAKRYLYRLHSWATRLGIDPARVYSAYARRVMPSLSPDQQRDLLMSCGIYYGDTTFYLRFPA